MARLVLMLFLACFGYAQSKDTVLRIAVILSNETSTDQYSAYLEDFLDLFLPDHDVTTTWIHITQQGLAGNSEAVTKLTETPLSSLDAVFSAAESCATILKISAAFNIPVFTWNCKEDYGRISAQSDYSTHIRIDPTIKSLIPYIQALLSDVYSNVKIEVWDIGQTIAAKLLASKLKTPVDVCQPCVAESEKDVLVLMGNSSEVVRIIPKLDMAVNHWKMIVLATSDVTTEAQLMKIKNGLSRTDSDIHLIHPAQYQSYLNDDPTFSSYKEAVSLYLSFISHEGSSRRPVTTDYSRVGHLLDDIKSKCFQVYSPDGISSFQCYDEYAWSLGNSLYWRYKTNPCHSGSHEEEEAEEHFYSYANLTSTGRNKWKLQMIGCNETEILHPNISRALDGEVIKKDIAKTMTIQALYIIIAVLVIIILAGMVLLLWWRLRKHRAMSNLTSKPNWHVNCKDIRFFECDVNQNHSGAAADSMSLYSQSPTFVTDNDKLDAAGKGEGTTIDFGYLRDQPVVMKKIALSEFQPTKQNEKELENMVNIHHENVARFFGVCVKPAQIILITQYCIKGSLEELFLFEPVHMDETFIASIVMDIVRGMTYLHKNSSISVHGNLKSSNCLVTSRWVVKLSGFGLPEIRNKFKEDRDLLWCAPEIIKQSEVASQKADVYSFGIILYEVIGKEGPFGKNYSYSEEELQALISQICEYHYHPETSWLCCEDYLKNVMLACWQTPPKLRPDFPTLSSQLKPFRAIMNGRSIIDNMLVMMERYQMRLEDLVEEKTAQLQLEKRKTENLLHRMLPPQVADQLISGKKVSPESFSCITVFFSDICGFTSLASTATPIQVIQLLNDLYTLFDSIIKHYDVYKVETVGDAYLCVSGLPRPNGDRHASEIALMALEFIRSLKNFKIAHKSGTDQDLQMRIGIHSGQCVAGVVGVSMPRYTLFGDTINVASRLETTSEPMKIQISQETKHLLDKQENYFVCEKRGKVDLKGKGETETWWLQSTVTPIPPHSDYTPQHLSVSGLISDTLQVPGSAGYTGAKTDEGRQSATSSEVDLLLKLPSLCRTRSNSVKSHCSTSKSAQVFQRAGSFRHKIKCDSLSTPQMSEDNLHKKSSTSVVPPFLVVNEETTRLLSAASSTVTPKHSFSHNSKIVIQVDEAE